MQVIVSDAPQCEGCKYAMEHGIATLAYPASSKTIADGKQLGVTTEKLIDSLSQGYDVDYVLLAGYLKVRVAQRRAITPTVYMTWALCTAEVEMHVADIEGWGTCCTVY